VLRDDKQLVLSAVSKCGCGPSLYFASDRLKEDIDVVLSAMDSFMDLDDADSVDGVVHGDFSHEDVYDDLHSLHHAGKKLRHSRRFWRQAMCRNNDAFHQRPSRYRRDQGLIFQHRSMKRK
jgi:hypothetical protein